MGWKQRREKRREVGMNRARARQRAIEAGPAPDYPEPVDHRGIWCRITIEQHHPATGITKDVVMLYKPEERVDSWYMKDGDRMLMKERGRPKLIGAYRAFVRMSKKIIKYGRVWD